VRLSADGERTTYFTDAFEVRDGVDLRAAHALKTELAAPAWTCFVNRAQDLAHVVHPNGTLIRVHTTGGSVFGTAEVARREVLRQVKDAVKDLPDTVHGSKRGRW